MRHFAPLLALAVFLSLAAPAAAFDPTEGKYQTDPSHYRHLVFHFAGHRVFDITFGGATVAHAHYHPGDHSFTVTSTGWSIDGHWTNPRTVHGHYTIYREKTVFVAHVHAPAGS
jgi:hypothetical protein